MQQLTLQFEGFAGSAQPIDVAATTRRKVARVKDFVSRVRTLFAKDGKMVCDAKAWLHSHAETLQESVECAALMAAGVFILYMAAVLQGGAV